MGLQPRWLARHPLHTRYFRWHAETRRCASDDLLALGETVAADHDHHLRRGLSDGVVHRHPRPEGTGAVAVPDHHSVLDQPADPHLRDQRGAA
ncbi:UNVERIFIED_CONTAM: hypothetical protein NCL1_06559 [Trichonephila clavipes]